MVFGMMSKKKKNGKGDVPKELDAFWMPFTPQRDYKKNKLRTLVSAEGMYYKTDDGRTMLDGCSGFGCTNFGHNHPKITEAIQRQAAQLDFAPNFQFSSPVAFEAADRLCKAMPEHINHVFFSNSGSEAVDTALKIALAYWRARGKPEKTKMIGRLRSYHGVNFGGISVGGISYMRKNYASALIPGCDHLPHTHNLEHQAFSKGQPQWGAHLADELENMIYLHSAENIACVIVEPVAGSTGTLVPPVGYLERLREICTKHDILLIFDEVITAWARLGYATAAEKFNVMPDIITSAKGITNATVPLGATFVSDEIYDAFMQGPENHIEFLHGYTYSGHPLSCAAALATQELIDEDGMYEKAQAIAPVWEDALHTLKDAPYVVDVRACGLMGGVQIDLGDRPHDQKSRAAEVFNKMFFEQDITMRYTVDVLGLYPSVIVNEEEIGTIVDRLRTVLKQVG